MLYAWAGLGCAEALTGTSAQNKVMSDQNTRIFPSPITGTLAKQPNLSAAVSEDGSKRQVYRPHSRSLIILTRLTLANAQAL
jgi:hypothetical protein